jgi:hypothetical protein
MSFTYLVIATQSVNGYRVEIHRDFYQTREAAVAKQEWFKKFGYKVNISRVMSLD